MRGCNLGVRTRWAVGVVQMTIGWINTGHFTIGLFCDPVLVDHLSIVSNMPTHTTNLQRIYRHLSNPFLTSGDGDPLHCRPMEPPPPRRELGRIEVIVH